MMYNTFTINRTEFSIEDSFEDIMAMLDKKKVISAEYNGKDEIKCIDVEVNGILFSKVSIKRGVDGVTEIEGVILPFTSSDASANAEIVNNVLGTDFSTEIEDINAGQYAYTNYGKVSIIRNADLDDLTVSFVYRNFADLNIYHTKLRQGGLCLNNFIVNKNTFIDMLVGDIEAGSIEERGLCKSESDKAIRVAPDTFEVNNMFFLDDPYKARFIADEDGLIKKCVLKKKSNSKDEIKQMHDKIARALTIDSGIIKASAEKIILDDALNYVSKEDNNIMITLHKSEGNLVLIIEYKK